MDLQLKVKRNTGHLYGFPGGDGGLQASDTRDEDEWGRSRGSSAKGHLSGRDDCLVQIAPMLAMADDWRGLLAPESRPGLYWPKDTRSAGGGGLTRDGKGR